MGLAIGADSIDWGEIAKKGTSTASKGARANPIGILLTGILTPGNLNGEGDERVKMLNDLAAADNAIQGIGSISDKEKNNALQLNKELIKAIEAELAQSCNANNKQCKKEEHRGKVHSQNGKDDIVSADQAATNWNLPYAPSLSLCKAFAKRMRLAMLNIKGHSANGKGIDYEKGATKAFETMNAWMEKVANGGGTGVEKWSFNFDGVTYRGGKPPRQKNSIDNRRIDLDIFKGQILKSKL